MTAPTITHGHGFLDDEFTLANWTLGNVGLPDAAQSNLIGDVIMLSGTPDNVADEYCYTTRTISSLAISTTLFPTVTVRWKTSQNNNALGFYLIINYTAASGGGNSTIGQTGGAPSFNDTWTTSTGTLTAGRIIESIQILANDYPDSLATGPHYVYVDFIMIHKGTFTFPYVGKGGVRLQLPTKLASLEIPGRDGDIHQKLGMNSPLITISGSMITGTWGTTDFPYGEYFYKILRDSDPWQWLTSDRGNFKVTPDASGFDFNQDTDDESMLKYQLPFKVYSLSSLGETTWADRQWYGK